MRRILGRAAPFIRMTLMSVAVSSAVLLVSPSAGSADSAIGWAERLVLTSRQVGHGYAHTDESFTRRQIAEQGSFSIGQLRAWGYEGGFERVFDHDADTPQGIQIASDGGVYRTAHGAEESLLNNARLCTQTGFSPVGNPNLAGGSTMCTKTGTEDGYRGRLFFLVWRVGRYKGSISLSGVQSNPFITRANAIQLAREQLADM